MKRSLILIALTCLSCTGNSLRDKYGMEITLPDEIIADKIRGAWYGQTIGCTYGGPTEFKYKGGIINEAIPIVWYEDYIYDTFKSDPGLYDDVYMDLTFVEVMAKEGLDAPVSAYAEAFANADYKLWHANQAARYNILNGIKAPESGCWTNNPHADDIDFQIESDFIGMMTPGMPNTSSEICDRLGHIMNYGDGWYGGVFISAMYSLAYFTDNISEIVTEALLTIPENTKFRSCIEDVLKYWKTYPNNWEQCWFEVDKRHGLDIGCPEGVFNGFNIDAVINAAYVVIGLLYGNGDFEKTMEISTRCGQDSDCNPATAAGILGTIYGYKSLGDSWKQSVERIENEPFPYTSLSLNTVCEVTQSLMKEIASSRGLTQPEDGVRVVLEKPQPVRFEQSFTGIRPKERRVLKATVKNSLDLEFSGCAVVLMGSVSKIGHDHSPYIADVSVFIDGEKVEDFKMPFDYIKRKYDIFYKYGIPEGSHTLKVVVNNPHNDYVLNATELVVYENEE